MLLVGFAFAGACFNVLLWQQQRQISFACLYKHTIDFFILGLLRFGQNRNDDDALN